MKPFQTASRAPRQIDKARELYNAGQYRAAFKEAERAEQIHGKRADASYWQMAAALGMPVYFCEKASPWQRPSNENTSGLLRQYFPKGSDLRVHGPGDLAAVAAELNARPRKTLGWDTPAGRLGR